MSNQIDEEAVFHLARKLPNEEDRAIYLDQVCGDDTAARIRLEAMLESDGGKDSFLRPKQDLVTTSNSKISEQIGNSIGPYRLLEQIGEGGMGIVFVAEQQFPIRRKVALKVIKPGMDTRAVIARFEAERQAVAMMDHPNIAKVLDAGATDAGRPFFAMELVKGIPVTEYCDQNCLTIAQRLELFVEICHAIQHAHQKGVVHRDIKPSNVLVTLADGKPVPKVIDFGVAKALNAQLTDKTVYTAHFSVVGTLLYMSPEQAEMSSLDVDTRSDIYSLGVLLYELLTGTTPFQKEQLNTIGFDEQRRAIREKEPPRASARISSLGETATIIAGHRRSDPKKLHQILRGDLDWILQKAMDKDRTRRYDNASSLADDLRRYLSDETIEARPPSLGYQVLKFGKRNRYAVGTAIALSITLVSGLVGTTFFLLKANDLNDRLTWETAKAVENETIAKRSSEEAESSRKRAEVAMVNAEQASRRLARELYFSDISLAYQMWDENNFEGVRKILAKYRRPSGEDFRGFEWQYLWNATSRRRKAQVISFQDVPSSVAFSNDGTLYTNGWDGVIREHTLGLDPSSREVLNSTVGEHRRGRGGQWATVFLMRGNLPACYVTFWETQHTARLRCLDTDVEVQLEALSPMSGFALTHDASSILVTNSDQEIQLLESATGRPTATLKGSRSTSKLAISPDASIAAFINGDVLEVWDFGDEKMLWNKNLDYGWRVNDLQFSPDGNQLAICTEDGTNKLIVCNATTGELIAGLADHLDAVRSLAFSPNGKLLASASRDNSVKLWDTQSYALVETLKGHSGIVNDVSFSKDGLTLASTSQDYSAVVWDITDLYLNQPITNGIRPIDAWTAFKKVQFNESGKVQFGDNFAAYLFADHIRRVDLRTGEEIPATGPWNQSVTAFATSKSGRLAVAHGGKIEVWAGARRTFAGSAQQEIRPIAISTDGNWVVFGGVGGLIGIIDLQSNSMKQRTSAQSGDVNVVRFSHDGEHFASAGGQWGSVGDSGIEYWRTTDLMLIKSFPGHADAVRGLTFTPDDTRIVSASWDNTIGIWEVAGDTVEPERVIKGHTASVTEVIFDRKAKRMLSSGGDRMIRIWDWQTGEQCGYMQVPVDLRGFSSLTWADGENMLIAADNRGGVHFFDGSPDE